MRQTGIWIIKWWIIVCLTNPIQLWNVILIIFFSVVKHNRIFCSWDTSYWKHFKLRNHNIENNLQLWNIIEYFTVVKHNIQNIWQLWSLILRIFCTDGKWCSEYFALMKNDIQNILQLWSIILRKTWKAYI